jgi:DNA-binding NtrC family response regulator
VTDPDLTLKDLEYAGLKLAMEKYGPRRKEAAAKALGLSRKALYDKLAKYPDLKALYVRPRAVKEKA